MLRSPRFSTLGRHVVAASIALVSGSLVACGDAATAPQAPAVARDIDRPSEVVLQVAAFLTVRAVDTTGKNLSEIAWVNFKTANPQDTMSVRDNTAKDLDPTIGVIKVAMAKAQTYTACFSMSAHYRGDYTSQTYPQCQTVTSNAINVDMGKVYGKLSPVVTFLTKNEFGALIGGATFNLNVASQNWSLTFTDGNPYYDESAGVNGNVTYNLHYPNAIAWCEVSPPPKTHLVSPKCGSFNAQWGKTYVITLAHETLIF